MKVQFDKTWKIGPIALIALGTLLVGFLNLYAIYSNTSRADDKRLTTIETKVDIIQRSVERLENKLFNVSTFSSTTARN